MSIMKLEWNFWVKQLRDFEDSVSNEEYYKSLLKQQEDERNKNQINSELDAIINLLLPQLKQKRNTTTWYSSLK